MSTTRISGDQRRRAIVRAATPLFARDGLHGTTTRALAAAAGVSEALLYRHFPSKEALYRAVVVEHVGDVADHEGLEAILALPASTEKLVRMVAYWVRHILDGDDRDLFLLMVQSLTGGDVVGQALIEALRKAIVPEIWESMEAARQSGDLRPDALQEADGVMIIQAVIWGTKLMGLASPSGNKTEHALAFVLRGLGVKEEAYREFV